jgi:hypothetical protein
LTDLRSDLQDASDAADRLSDCDASWDIGLELLDARKAVNAALDALERATAPKVAPSLPPPWCAAPRWMPRTPRWMPCSPRETNEGGAEVVKAPPFKLFMLLRITAQHGYDWT